MPPRPVRASRARLRRATIRAASSRESAPATQAAAISPWEWPTTASGTIPCARHSSASDTITENSTGCTTSTRSSGGASGSSRRTASSDQSRCGARARSQAAIRSAKAGAWSSSSRAMPAHWDPWPGKTRTVLADRATVPSTRPGARSPAASAARPPSRVARSSPTTAARCSKALLVVAREWPTSTDDSSGCSVR